MSKYADGVTSEQVCRIRGCRELLKLSHLGGGRERFTFADHQNGPERRRIMTAMTMGMPVAEALLELLPAESGGLRSALPAGTRSLMIVFPSLEEPGAEVSYGAVIDTADGAALIPGTAQIPVTVRFWADDAVIYAVPGAAFTLWYGRLVGTGAVTRIDDVTATRSAFSGG